MNTTELETLKNLSQMLIDKSAELDYLIHTQRKILSSLYMTLVGNLKLELLNLQLDIQFLQRKIEEINACINKNENPDLKLIDLKIQIELIETKEKINQQTEMLTAAKEFLQNIKPVVNEREIKSLYSKMAHKLHPDVIPEYTDEHKIVWEQVQKAYQEKNIEKLKSLQLVYADLLNIEIKHTEQSIEKQLLKVTSEIKEIDLKIAQLYQTFPFDIEKNLYNDDWISQQNQETNEWIKQHQNYYLQLQKTYHHLTHGL